LFFLRSSYWKGAKVLTKGQGDTVVVRADEEGEGEEEDIECAPDGENEMLPVSLRALPEFSPAAVEGRGGGGGGGGEEGKGDDDNGVERLHENEAPRAKVVIRSLRKRYANGKLALKKLNLAMLEGQITCLLGANGAGKSTTISLLTGLIEASAGEVDIYGYSLSNDLAAVRKLTGICPQQNVILPTLTVREHLEIFAAIKGIHNDGDDDSNDHHQHRPSRARDKAVRAAVEEVGLTDKLDVPSAALSGGMKRKLCLAIALIGDPKFVLLDEPTSGMDPYSRRSTWEMLLKHKAGRVVVLTTHFMEEADSLGDRIVIMSEGTLRCSGSSLYLKNRFGAGYVLALAREKQDHDETMHGDEAVDHHRDHRDHRDHRHSPSTTEELYNAVRELVPGAHLASEVAGETIFSLPLDATGQFSALFSYFKEKATALGVTSYGISVCTLEQVFVRLATEAKRKASGGDGHGDDDDDGFDEEASFMGRLGAMIRRLVAPSPPATHQRQHQHQHQDGGNYNPPGDNNNPQQQQQQGSGPRDGGSYLKVASAAGENEGEEEDGDAEEEEGEGTDLAGMGTTGGLDSVRLVSETSPVSALASTDIPGDEHKEHEEEGNPNPTLALEGHDCGDGEKEKNEKEESEKNSKNNNVKEKEEGTASEKGWQLVLTQFRELMKKRLVIASRDFKGVFFQLLFPALQVLLVLAILTVSYSPAGRTVKLGAQTLDAALAFDTPGVLVPPAQSTTQQQMLSEPLTASPHMVLLSPDLSVSGWDPEDGVYTSNAASRYLLHTTKLSAEEYDAPLRYGALLFNDSVTVNATVNWDWVKDNLDYLLENQEQTESFLALFGVRVDLDQALADPVTISNFTLTFDNDNGTVTITESDASSGRRRLQSLADLVGDNSSVDSITVGGVTINVTAANEALTELVLANSANISAALNGSAGSVTLSQADVLRVVLPDGVEEYRTALDSPHTVGFNTTSAHGAAIFRGELLNAAFAMCSPLRKYWGGNPGIYGDNPRDIPTPQYIAKNHPLPISRADALEIRLILSVLAALFILIPLCYAPAAFVAFVVIERESKSKHLQTISGVSPHLYWLATLVWDCSLYTLLTLLTMACFFIYGENSIFVSTAESTSVVFLLILLYGFSAIPLSYLYSFMFTNHSTAQISIMAINFGTGFIAVLAVLIMESLPETAATAEVLVKVFRMFPPYLLGEGFINLAEAFYVNLIVQGGEGEQLLYFEWRVGGRCLAYMAMEAAGYFAIVQLSESRLYRFVRRAIRRSRIDLKQLQKSAGADVTADTDVMEEHDRITRNGPSQYSLYLRGLAKAYPPAFLGAQPKLAVRGVSFGLHDGERFGLLGINGAGKTTTLGMLTGEEDPSAGELAVDGISTLHPDFLQKLGFCPQVDPLLELMTSYETLHFFGRIRGISEADLAMRVPDLVQRVGLCRHASRPCGTYSGGNKRKLSLAVALIGNPRVLLLDEPSTGMDPEARRGIWSVIEAVSVGRSVVLVSHSMEECEALCTRIGIMVGGRLRCLGSSQHLKSRFGSGYQIEVRVATTHSPSGFGSDSDASNVVFAPSEGGSAGGSNSSGVDGVTECLRTVIATQHLVVAETHGGYARYSVAGSQLDLAAVFGCLEGNKARLRMLDYSVSQASLEQVFLRFAAQQEEEKGALTSNGITAE
jgi:ABC-type multidrug transport system ATPase subunit